MSDKDNVFSIEPAEMREVAAKEADAFVKFIAESKVPALVVIGIDTVPDVVDGAEKHKNFSAAVGTPDAIINLIAWLTATVVPALQAGQAAAAEGTEAGEAAIEGALQ